MVGMRAFVQMSCGGAGVRTRFDLNVIHLMIRWTRILIGMINTHLMQLEWLASSIEPVYHTLNTIIILIMPTFMKSTKCITVITISWFNSMIQRDLTI
jgi:hypothetical protein